MGCCKHRLGPAGWAILPFVLQATHPRPCLRGAQTCLLVGRESERGGVRCASVAPVVQGVGCDAVVESSTQISGLGLVGEVEGRTVMVGTAELLSSRGVADTDGRLAADAREWGSKGKYGWGSEWRRLCCCC